jgi:polysaccharide deacetylase family protein (PEP-CTERM system associated)
MINALTVDVEDYYWLFSRYRFDSQTDPGDAVVRCIRRLLDLFDQHQVKATFFVLGQVGWNHPGVVKDIAARGHELASHGHSHMQVFKFTPAEFRTRIRDAKKCIEDLGQCPVLGHRAAAFSLRPDTQWALEVLAEVGFRYDSSISPASVRRYGWPGVPENIHRMKLPNGSTIIEAPIPPVHVLGKALPACGGGYLRHFPYWYTHWAFRRIERHRPVIVYTHPYEIDTEPPSREFTEALKKAPREHKRHHRILCRNRSTVLNKLERLLKTFRFAPLGCVIDSVLGRDSQAPESDELPGE